MAILYYAERVHIAQTRTLIPTPYFCTGQESESDGSYTLHGSETGTGTGKGTIENEWGYRFVSTYDLPDSKPTGGGGGVAGVLCQVKTQSAKICLNFNFWGGGGTICQVKTQCAKICLNFNFQVGGGSVPRVGALSEFWTKIYCSARNLLVHHR